MGTEAILITGASGFIGTALRTHFGEQRILVATAGTESVLPDGRARCAALYRDLVAKLDHAPVSLVYHLAGSGIPSYARNDRQRQFWANCGTSIAVAKALIDTNFSGRLVFASSGSVYGNTGTSCVTESHRLQPCTNYGRSKAMSEALLKKRLAARCDLCIARLFHVFGPGQRKLVVYEISSRILSHQAPLRVIGTGKELRDFVFVADAVRALAFIGLGIPKDLTPQTFNVSSAKGTTIAEIAHLLVDSAGRQGTEITFEQSMNQNPIHGCIGDNSKLSSLGMRVPVASRANFQKTIAWISTTRK